MSFKFSVLENGIAQGSDFGTTVVESMQIHPCDEEGSCKVEVEATHGPSVGLSSATALPVNGVRVMMRVVDAPPWHTYTGTITAEERETILT